MPAFYSRALDLVLCMKMDTGLIVSLMLLPAFQNRILLFLNPLDLAAPNMVKFGIESKFSSLLTSTQKFKEAVADSMKEMQSLCEMIVEEDSKLVLTSHL